MFFQIFITLILPLILSLGLWFLSKRNIDVKTHFGLTAIMTLIVTNAFSIVKYDASFLNQYFTAKRAFVYFSAIVFVAAIVAFIICNAKTKLKKLPIYRMFSWIALSIVSVGTLYYLWLLGSLGNITFDIILFNILSPINSETGTFTRDIIAITVPSVVSVIAWRFVIYSDILTTPINKKSKSHVGIAPKIFSRALPLVLAIAVLMHASYTLKMPEIYNYFTSDNELFETYYIDPNSVDIKFPEQKRNLIYIFFESLEATYFDKANGGAMEQNLIPSLTKYLDDGEAVNFSHQSTYGGIRTVPGATWSIGGMVTQTSGIPYVWPPTSHEDGTVENYMPGLTNLGDILYANGYHNRLIVGARSSDYGVKSFYEQHGNYDIYDRLHYIETGQSSHEYFKGQFGIEDRTMLEFAKESILEMSAGDQPFHAVVETVDTHFPDGYVDELCDAPSIHPYENSITCDERIVADFIDWIKAQDFYENTTIVVNGDHLSMDKTYFTTIASDYERTTFNMIINPVWDELDPSITRNRGFNATDIFPTVLSAIGVEIEGSKLGIATDLSSGVPTLTETIGHDPIFTALGETSQYYNRKIFWNKDNEE
ncbi:LTA synthase family protein [Erysipelothrix anatis]|uniref:LTA synthase family protein n=1 Tax=Erysipelothrix anatis TaxID=2683713 RepID=UPI0013594155|nr:LTA synthase family protein [Erysipelothrix anatis]